MNFKVVERAGLISDIPKRLVHLRLAGLASLHGKALLDCGCGAGKDAAILSKLGNFVVGTDISMSALKMAKQTASNLRTHLDLVCCDSEELPFRREVFDLCYCSWTLHHFPRIELVLAQLNSVLRKGEALVIIEPNGSNVVVRISQNLEDLCRPWLIRRGADTPNERLHDCQTYVESLARAGFSHVRVLQWFGGGIPPVPRNDVILYMVVRVRALLLECAWKYLPPPFNGADLVARAQKD